MRPVLTLETERLLLRPFRDTDIEPYAAMCADPDVMRYVGDRGVRSLMPSSLFDGSERSVWSIQPTVVPPSWRSAWANTSSER